jgi:hypothetical protein
MFTEGYSFPHPVLGNEDDITGEFNIVLEINRSENRKLVFENFSAGITNDYIQSLIDEGSASCFVKVHCSSTFRTWMFDAAKNIELDENDIANKIEVQVMVITQSEIQNYSDSSFNVQYGRENFILNRNEVIAISGKETIQIPKVDEKLGLGNIFKFNSHTYDKPIRFQFLQDKIYINYPETKRGEHPPNMLFQTSPWTAFNIFIVPALAEALKFIDKDPNAASRYDWFTVIDSLKPAEERTPDFFADAQEMLQTEMPVLLSYNELTRK